jgi:hypothetical protein
MIDSQFLMSVALDVGKSFAGVGLANALDLDSKLDFGNNFAARHASNGAVSFLTSEAIDLVSGAGSKLMTFNWIGAADDVLFLGALSAGFEVVGVDSGLYSIVNRQLGTSRDTAKTLTDAGLLSGSRVLARFLEGRDEVPTMVKNIRHPVRTLMTMSR